MRQVLASPELEALRHRKRLLDDFWLLSFLLVLLALSVPWFLGILNVALVEVAWSLFAFAAAYVLISLAFERAESVPLLHSLAAVLHLGGILTLALLWHFTGGWRNAVLLFVFVLPVIAGSLFFTRWQSLCFALLAGLLIAFLALMSSQGLQWYLAQAGFPVAPLLSLLSALPATLLNPLPGLDEAPAHLAYLLIGFLMLMLAAALAGELIEGLVRRLESRVDASAGALLEAESFSDQMMLQSTTPVVLLLSDNLRILNASQSFFRQFFLDPAALAGHTLLSALSFLYPEVVEGLIAGEGGDTVTAVCNVRGEKRVLKVNASRVKQGKYVFVSFHDVSEQNHMRLALDAVEEPVVVVDPNGLVILFNTAAGRLLKGLEPGVKAGAILADGNLPFGWWELGIQPRRERAVQLAGRSFKGRSVAATVPGDPEPLTIITLLPLEGGL